MSSTRVAQKKNKKKAWSSDYPLISVYRSSILQAQVIVPQNFPRKLLEVFLGGTIVPYSKELKTLQTIKLCLYSINGESLLFSYVEDTKSTPFANFYSTNYRAFVKGQEIVSGMLADDELTPDSVLDIALSKRAKSYLTSLGILPRKDKSIESKPIKVVGSAELVSEGGTETGISPEISDSCKSEELFLVNSISSYLNQLGLKGIDLENTTVPLHYLSTYGDSAIRQDLLLRVASRNFMDIYLSNENMKYALVRLGLLDDIYKPVHTLGTLFEVLYACAKLQGNQGVSEKLLVSLVGTDILSKSQAFQVVFKEG